MRRFAAGWVFGALLATLALLLARFVEPAHWRLELDVYILGLGGMALLACVIAAREAYPLEERSALERALDRRADAAPRLADLARLEREVALGAATAFDFHYRLHPVLREIVLQRLERRGVMLETDDDVARAIFGDEVWELVRPDRPSPTDRHGRGPGLDAVRRVVEALEGAEA